METIDFKQLPAFTDGLIQGIEKMAVNLPTTCKYYTKKDLNAWHTGLMASATCPDLVDRWCEGQYTPQMIDYLLAISYIKKSGWYVFKSFNGYFIEQE